jgi:DNA-binding CsgD family transcriptional regulator
MGMFLLQFFYYLFRPQDRNRLWYLILLFLLLLYNITGGLFPDPKINLPVSTQEMMAYGSGFLMASYFPFYFYRAFNLSALRWHALYGVPLFLMLPYLIFFVIIYAINGNLQGALKWGMIIPFIYAIVLLWVMFRAIMEKNRKEKNREQFLEAVALYIAVSPWASLTVFGVVESSQLTEVLCTNSGIIVITILFIYKSVKNARQEHERLLQLGRAHSRDSLFEEMCRFYRLTNREIEVVLLIRQGLTHKAISERLFIAGKTVDNHVQNIYEKTGASSKTSLLHKLYN